MRPRSNTYWILHINFNPRTYVRCDNQHYFFWPPDWSFQSTHLREVRQNIVKTWNCIWVFQSTHLREVRPSRSWTFWPAISFQSTHLREVRLHMTQLTSPKLTFQSTHLREVRPNWAWLDPLKLIISIHAPTWGATTLMVATTVTDIHFNPRTYVRCDFSHCE